MNRRTGLAFAALCLLSGSAWLLDVTPLLALSGLLRAAVHLATLSAIFALASLRRSSPWNKAGLLPIAGWSAALLALPLLIAASSSGHLSSFTVALAFALVPALSVFFVGQTSGTFGEDRGALARLTPALAAMGGLALLIPFTAPSSVAGNLWLAAVIVSAGLSAFAGLRLHALLTGVPLLKAAATAGGASSLILCALFWITPHAQAVSSPRAIAIEVAVCLLLDGPILLLTIWLLRQLDPIAFSTRFLLIPLVTIAEGFLLLRPDPTWTMLAGAALVAFGSFALLRNPHQP